MRGRVEARRRGHLEVPALVVAPAVDARAQRDRQRIGHPDDVLRKQPGTLLSAARVPAQRDRRARQRIHRLFLALTRNVTPVEAGRHGVARAEGLRPLRRRANRRGGHALIQCGAADAAGRRRRGHGEEVALERFRIGEDSGLQVVSPGEPRADAGTHRLPPRRVIFRPAGEGADLRVVAILAKVPPCRNACTFSVASYCRRMLALANCTAAFVSTAPRSSGATTAYPWYRTTSRFLFLLHLSFQKFHMRLPLC